MKNLKNKINLKIQIPKISSKEESHIISINHPNENTKNSVSEITDNIYISGYLIGKNIPFLKKNNFTHVINCCVGSSFEVSENNNNNNEEFLLQQLYERNDIKYLAISLRDDPEADIFHHFFKIIKFLETEENIQNKKILFHCIEGISRAPAMVAGYLMWKKKYKFMEVIEFIKSKRNCIDINLGFNIQLNKWENYLMATKKKKKIFEIKKNGEHLIKQ